jgi:hypothetical protein
MLKTPTPLLLLASLALLLLGQAPSLAHHGAAAYDTALTTLTATVTGFDWKNPHALIHLSATDDTGATTDWTAETAGLVILVRAGWTRQTLTPGDRVTVVGRKALNGAHAMLLRQLTLANGRTFTSFVPPR